MMRDLKNGEVHLVEGSHFTVLARSALEKYAHGGFVPVPFVEETEYPRSCRPVQALRRHKGCLRSECQ